MPVVNPGIRRYIGSAIQRLFNSASFSAPLTHSLTLERGTGTPTFTRATTATVTDNEGILRTAIAGEARFTGARRVENLIRLGAAQSSTLAIGASVTMTLPAGTYIFSQGVSGGTATFSGTGGATGTLAASASVRTSVVKTITAGTLIVTGSVAILTDIHVENITGRTDQTTPSEYVSVGALDYRSTQDPLSLSLPSGGSASTPDSVPASITGDMDIRWVGAANDWTSGATQTLISKWNVASYYLAVSATGKLIFQTAGTNPVNVTSTASVPFSDLATGGLRVTFDANNGAGGSTTTFYYSNDLGVTWTLLEAGTVTAGVSVIDDTVDVVRIGALGGGATLPFAGKVFSAQIYNGIDGTLAVDFNVNRDATTPTGTITSSTTGEVWTINGASSVVRNAAYHGAGVDGVKYFNTDLTGDAIPAATNLGYLAEAASTNLAWPSEDLTNVRYVSGGGGIAVVADQAVAPDGTTTADQLTASGANGTLIQDLGVVASAARNFSIYLKRKTGTGNIDLTLDGGATWTTKAITTTEWTRVDITQTLADPDIGIRIVTSGDAIYAWGVQCE